MSRQRTEMWQARATPEEDALLVAALQADGLANRAEGIRAAVRFWAHSVERRHARAAQIRRAQLGITNVAGG